MHSFRKMNLLPGQIKVDVANTLNHLGVQTPIAQQQIAHKAIRNDLNAPKRKHVRSIYPMFFFFNYSPNI